MIARNKGAISNTVRQQDERGAHLWHRKNIKTLIVNNTAVALSMAAMAAGFYGARKPLAGFFLPSTIDTETRTLAETLLVISMAGMIGDAVRLIGAGALRGWQDILFPTIVSFLTMIAVGLPAGWGLGQRLGNEASWIFHMRNLTVLAAGLIMLGRCRKQLSYDERKINTHFHSINDETAVAVSSLNPLATANESSIQRAPSTFNWITNLLFFRRSNNFSDEFSEQERQNPQLGC